MTAAALSGVPAASGDRGGRIPFATALPSGPKPDLEWRATGGGVTALVQHGLAAQLTQSPERLLEKLRVASGRASVGAGRPLAGARGSAVARVPLAAAPRQAAPSRRPLPCPRLRRHVRPRRHAPAAS